MSELLTNAVKASRSLGWHSPVRLWVLSDKAHVLVLVWDANPQPPMRIEAGEEVESGRGLLLVEAVSDQWDWYQPDGWDGKVVWAKASLGSPNGPHPASSRNCQQESGG